MTVTIPDYQTLMLPVLRLAADGERKVVDVVDIISNQFALSESERAEILPSGRQRVVHNRIHWAKFYMSKAGLIASPSRGRFLATDAGRALLATSPEKISVKDLMRIPEFQSFYRRSDINPAGNAADNVDLRDILTNKTTPDDQIENAYNASESMLRDEILDRIIQNTPIFFERLIIGVLVAMGYGGSYKNAAAQLGRSGDGGIDGVINEDRLGLDRVYVQAKRYSDNTVGRPEVQAFVGSLVGLGATKGVFVTTSTFSAQARDFVKHLTQRVVLIEGRQLTELMVEHNVGVTTRKTLEFKQIDENFFSEEI